MIKKQNPKSGFTIVELLVVIVVIGILAAISFVSYSGITERAIAARIKSDLSTNTKLLELYKIEHDEYPRTIGTETNCPDSPIVDNQYCLKVSEDDDTLTYEGDGGTGGGAGDTYTLTITDDDSDKSYEIVPGGQPIAVESGGGGSTASTFIKAVGGDGYDYGNSIVYNSDGGFTVVGQSDGFGAGSRDMTITRYDSTGTISWAKTWGGASSDEGNAIAKTSDGGYVVTGVTMTYGVSGSKDMFIVKYDSSGGITWNKTWGGPDVDTGYSVVQTSDGGYAVTGETYSYGPGTSDMFIVKYDSSGGVTWNKTWGGPSYNAGKSIIQTSDGGYAVTGKARISGMTNDDMFIVKYDSSGGVTWNKYWGGASSDYGNSVLQTSDSGYIVTGETMSYGTSGDMFIAKYDTSGNFSWNKIWGGASEERGNSIIQTSDGGYAVTGFSYSNSAGNDDAILVKYDSSGSVSWNRTWGTSGYEEGYSIIQTTDGGYVISGATDGAGSDTDDMLIARYNSTGEITGCNASMCKNPSASASSPSAGASSPSANVSTPSATISTPTASYSIPAYTTTTIVPVN